MEEGTEAGRSLVKLREEEDEEEGPGTEQRRKYTNLGLDLGEREEQVTCHQPWPW